MLFVMLKNSCGIPYPIVTIVYFKAQIGSIIGSLIGSIIGLIQNET